MLRTSELPALLIHLPEACSFPSTFSPVARAHLSVAQVALARAVAAVETIDVAVAVPVRLDGVSTLWLARNSIVFVASLLAWTRGLHAPGRRRICPRRLRLGRGLRGSVGSRRRGSQGVEHVRAGVARQALARPLERRRSAPVGRGRVPACVLSPRRLRRRFGLGGARRKQQRLGVGAGVSEQTASGGKRCWGRSCGRRRHRGLLWGPAGGAGGACGARAAREIGVRAPSSGRDVRPGGGLRDGGAPSPTVRWAVLYSGNAKARG